MENNEKSVQAIIDERLKKLYQSLDEIEKFEKLEINGSLECRQIGERTYYRHIYYYERKQFKKTISEDEATMIATMQYYKKLKPVIIKEIKYLKNNNYTFDPQEKYQVYEALPISYKKFVTPLFQTTNSKIIEWKKKPLYPNPYRPDLCVFPTMKGEKVRSAEEQLIANVLYKKRDKLLYKYENKIDLPIENSYVFPDFEIISLRTGRVYFLEHFGMLDKDQYFKKSFIEKIGRYVQNGIYPRQSTSCYLFWYGRTIN